MIPDLKVTAEKAIDAIREVYVCMKEYPENCQKPISDLSQIAGRLYSELCAVDIVPTVIADRVSEDKPKKVTKPAKHKRGRPRKVK